MHLVELIALVEDNVQLVLHSIQGLPKRVRPADSQFEFHLSQALECLPSRSRLVRIEEEKNDV